MFERRIRMRGKIRTGEPRAPKLGRGGRPERFRREPLAAAWARCGERGDLLARDADSAQECLQGELRMARGGRRRHPSSPPRSAPRWPRRGRCRGRAAPTAPCGSLAMVAISAAVAGIEPVEPAAITGPSVLAASRAASAAISASRRAAGSILPWAARIFGHSTRAIDRNRSVSCQYSIEIFRHQRVEPVQAHLARRHVVHQAGEIVGERERRGRAGRDERRAAFAAHVGRRRPQRRPAAPAKAAARSRRVRPAGRARRPRSRRSRPAQTRSRPRRGRRARRCGAGSRRFRPVTSRKRSRASRHARRVGR